MDQNKKRTGIPVQEFTYGNAKATVWANKPVNGDMFVKISFCRIEALPDGRKDYQFSFYPQDLKDVADVAIRTLLWLREAAGVILPTMEKGPRRANGVRPVK